MTAKGDIFGLSGIGPNEWADQESNPRRQDAWPGGPGGGVLPQGTPGHGPLVQAGFGLLALAPRLSSRRAPADSSALRQSVERELTLFAERLSQQATDKRLVQLGHYSLCALLDDVVLNTPWGAESAWRNESLAGTLHDDVAAGENFFTYLDQARRAPDRARPLLELMSACLALGFEGRYRLRQGGAEALRTIRSDLALLLARSGGDPNPDLSGHWQGIPARYRGVTSRVPVWVVGAGVAAVLLLIYAGLELGLSAGGAKLDLVMAAMPPAGPVSIIRAAPIASLQLPIAQPLAPQLTACLGNEQASTGGIVTEDNNRVRVRLPGNKLFAKGRADVGETVVPVIVCLRGVLAQVPGQIQVLGYTDITPIHTGAFTDNWALSRARANGVAMILRSGLRDEGRVNVIPRAGNDPIAPNDSEAGRAMNRRVEIVLEKWGGDE